MDSVLALFRDERESIKTSQLHLGLAPHRQGTVLWHVLAVDTIGFEMTVSSHAVVVLPVPLGETELLADVDLLSARELELASPQSFDHLVLELIRAPHRDKDLSDPYTGCSSVSFAVSSSHSSLKPISSSARQHFVDAQDVEGMDPHPNMEGIFTAVLDEVFVAADPRSFKSL